MWEGVLPQKSLHGVDAATRVNYVTDIVCQSSAILEHAGEVDIIISTLLTQQHGAKEAK